MFLDFEVASKNHGKNMVIVTQYDRNWLRWYHRILVGENTIHVRIIDVFAKSPQGDEAMDAVVAENGFKEIFKKRERAIDTWHRIG